MSKFSVAVVFTAIISLALGVTLYYVILHTATDLPVSENQAMTGSALSRQTPVSVTDKLPFHFKTYPEPRQIPTLGFVSEEGKPLTLTAFRGKLVLLNIWATWCGPCREEMPALDRLQAKLGGPEFQVLPLSIDREGASVVKEFYQELGLKSLGIYVDDTMRATTILNIVGVPTTLLISADGREISRVLGPAEWDSAEVVREIQQYLKPAVAKGG